MSVPWKIFVKDQWVPFDEDVAILIEFKFIFSNSGDFLEVTDTHFGAARLRVFPYDFCATLGEVIFPVVRQAT